MIAIVALVYAALATWAAWKFFRLLFLHQPGEKSYGEQRRRLSYQDPFPAPLEVHYVSAFITNARGMLLNVHNWVPSTGKPRGLIFLCVGYGETNLWIPRERARRLAREGWAVHGIDYEGVGRSDGLIGFIESFDGMVEDVWRHYRTVRSSYPAELPAFLLGESMGGAVAIKLSLRDKHNGNVLRLSGAVLLAPMVKIADDMKPPEVIVNSLKYIAPLLPTLPVVPSPDVMSKAIRLPDKLAFARSNPFKYHMKPRLGTALQLLQATESVSERMEEFDLPVLTLQGLADTVTDPALAREFHERAGSSDKTIQLYEGAWHNLLFGEGDEVVQRCYADIMSWLEARCPH